MVDTVAVHVFVPLLAQQIGMHIRHGRQGDAGRILGDVFQSGFVFGLPVGPAVAVGIGQGGGHQDKLGVRVFAADVLNDGADVGLVAGHVHRLAVAVHFHGQAGVVHTEADDHQIRIVLGHQIRRLLPAPFAVLTADGGVDLLDIGGAVGLLQLIGDHGGENRHIGLVFIQAAGLAAHHDAVAVIHHRHRLLSLQLGDGFGQLATRVLGHSARPFTGMGVGDGQLGIGIGGAVGIEYIPARSLHAADRHARRGL